jgi:hypothetical protein
MASLVAVSEPTAVVVEIGGMAIRVCGEDAAFSRLLQERYAGFVSRSDQAQFELNVDIALPGLISTDDDVRVVQKAGRWSLDRGDFHAEWDAASARGRVRQTANPYSIDSVIRIVHTLLLAKEGGFLVHAASAIRNGRAFLFAGASGAGKTTLARLAPSDVSLLTDEISYVRKEESGYFAFGTPFAGELARSGENLRAPIAALYLLAQGRENRIERVSSAESVRSLLAHILFFAEDVELVKVLFESACEFLSEVPIYRLTFVPEVTVWEMIL